MPPVLHYTHRWLEVSAGFVHDQIARSRHGKIVLVRDRFENREAYPLRPVWSLAGIRERSRTRVDNPSMILAAGTLVRTKLCHVHFAYAAADVERLVRRREIPFVLSLHGHDASAWPTEHRRDVELLTRLVSAVIVPSNFLAARAVDLGFPGDRLRVIPAGVDTGWFAPDPDRDPDPMEVFFVGRLVEKKGVDVLLAAWPRVRAAVPAARLRLVGDGPLRPLVEACGLPGVVHERPDPSRRRAQVRDALRKAAIVVTPSRTAADGDVESLLLVNLEAQASGRAVVTTRHGGIPEFVLDGETAVLVDEADPAALADALVWLLRDPAARRRLGRAGVGWAADFDAGSCSARVDDVYDELLGRTRRPARR